MFLHEHGVGRGVWFRPKELFVRYGISAFRRTVWYRLLCGIPRQRNGYIPAQLSPVNQTSSLLPNTMILAEEHHEAWLNNQAGKEVLVPFPAGAMRAWPISLSCPMIPVSITLPFAVPLS
jgi:hypothetical protein